MLSSISRIFQPSTTSLVSNRSRNRDDERDPLAGTQAAREEDGTSSSGNRDRALAVDAHPDSTPLLTPKQSTHLSSSVSTVVATDGQSPGPPHVLWKAPSLRQGGQESPTKSVSGMSMVLTTPTTPGSGWGPQQMNRSASSPSLSLTQSPLLNPSAAQGYRPSSLGRQSSRSIRLGMDSLSASEDSEPESERSMREGGHTLPKQLSPIHEQQVPFPPHRKLSTDSVPRTPDSTRTFDRLNGHNAFINRTLKRSLSQTSTSTHLSSVSAVPPVIPPLDLRPNFQNALGVAHGPHSPVVTQPPVPRKSRLPAPSLPTVVGSPRQTNMVSVIYEDGTSASARTSSFITAPSVSVSLATPTGEQQRFSFGGNMYLDPSSFASDSARGAESETDGGETEETDATHHALPAGLYDVERADDQGRRRESGQGDTRPNSGVNLRPANPTPPSTHSRSQSRTPSRTQSRTQSQSQSRTASQRLSVPRPRSQVPSEESFLEKRWLRGLSFGEERFVLPPSVQPGRRGRTDVTYACILFWAGFVMPWCWLIGGWLLTTDGDVPEEERGPLLPLWHRRKKTKTRRASRDGRDAAAERPLVKAEEKRRADIDAEMAIASPDRARGVTDKRIKASSWYPLLAPSVESLAPSVRSAGSTKRVKRRSRRSVDPWIRRCRVAAAVSGLLLFAAFVVAIVFIALRA